MIPEVTDIEFSEGEENMDIVSSGLFFCIIVPMGLIYVDRKRKLDEKILAAQTETNRLLTELIDALKKAP
jgi:hypothetical protein